PTITVDSPKANATLGPSFPVTATATDNMGVESVVLLINGQERGSDEMADTGNKYIVNAINLPEGEHEIIMQATDNAGNITKTAPIKITVAKQVTGGDCLSNSDCKGNLCADDGTQKFCTESCSLDNDTCPSGFDCAAVGATAVCAFSADDETGGCCDAGNSSSSAAMFGAFMVGLVLLRKRRTA
ncbi:MAG TPA: Ig-like domain-containing protein, partial [Kofleriaceae bacterium]|nr:Ig-like domain-containing protein [Kofleriaceae bacterium]